MDPGKKASQAKQSQPLPVAGIIARFEISISHCAIASSFASMLISPSLSLAIDQFEIQVEVALLTAATKGCGVT
jgi:hypothetical protein